VQAQDLRQCCLGGLCVKKEKTAGDDSIFGTVININRQQTALLFGYLR
jgi:hypothetical protein